MKNVYWCSLSTFLLAFFTSFSAWAQPLDCFASYSYYSDPATPQSVMFFDASFTTSAVTNYVWDFGDGTSSNEPSPTHTYAQMGNYNVSLAISTDDSCSSSVTYNLTLFDYNCYPSFYYTMPLPNDLFTFQFIDYSYVLTGSITSYNWDFGDGSSSSEASPIHTYTEGGIFTATLTLETSDCGTLTLSQPVYSNNGWGPCETDFYAYSDFPVSTQNYFVGSQYTGGDVTSWLWNFGDGTTSMGQTATHEYQVAGVYDVTLTTTTTDGCQDVTTYQTYGYDPNACMASFWYSPTMGGNFDFYSYSYVPGNNVTYTWDFGDGTTATTTEPNVSHEYTTVGVYSATLTVSSDECSSTTTYDVWVDEYYLLDCIASFSYWQNNPSNWAELTFFDYSFSATGVTSWLWDFGDGTTSTEASPNHAYSAYGTYDVSLTITSADCENTMAYPVYVQENTWYDPCYSSFYYYQNYGDSTTVNFYADSYFWWFWYDSTYTNNYVFDWDFGDGTTGEGQNPVHTYPTTGTYSVTLHMTNAETGCDETITYDVFVDDNAGWWFDGCYASYWFSQDPAAPMSLTFYNASYSSSSNLAYTWDFGDGAMSTESDPTHTYGDDGIYNVSLTITGDDGCTNTFAMDVWIGDNVWYPDGCQAIFSADISGQMVNFMDFSTSSDNVTAWTWDFGDGLGSTDQNPSHEYSAPGIYTGYLTIATDDECSSTFQLDIDLLNGVVSGGNGFNFLIATTATQAPSVANLKVKIAPNPANSVVNMSFVSAAAFEYQAIISDVNGATIQRQNLAAKKGENTQSFDVSTLPSGVYALSLRTNDAVKTLRFVKF